MNLSRDEIIRRFESWLDAALSAEPAPDGIDAELLAAITAQPSAGGPDCDSYALWAAMTALTQEVKLQGRAFKDLDDTLGGQPGRIAEEVRAAYREREREVRRETERQCRKEALQALIDLRDRLGRGLESVRKGEAEIAKSAQRGWLAGLFSGPAHRQTRDKTQGTIAALIRGYELGLERLDQALEESNAREIRCQGEIFDARRMNAVDREESSRVPEGTVLEVYRSGYEWHGEVLRTAQVKVASAPANGSGHE